MAFVFEDGHADKRRGHGIGNHDFGGLDRADFSHVDGDLSAGVGDGGDGTSQGDVDLVAHNRRCGLHDLSVAAFTVKGDHDAVQLDLVVVELASGKHEVGQVCGGIAVRVDQVRKLRDRGGRLCIEVLRSGVFVVRGVDVDRGDGVAAQQRDAREARFFLLYGGEPFALEVAERLVRPFQRDARGFTGTRIQQRYAHGGVLRVVLVAHDNLELQRVVGHRAGDGASVFADELELACGAVALAELDVVGAVVERTAAVLLAFLAFRVRAGEHGDVYLVRADGQLHRDVEVVLARFVVIYGRILQLLRSECHAVDPDVGHVAAFGDERRTADVHRAGGGVDLDVGSVGYVERRVVGDRHLVVGLLRHHFLVRRAEAGDEFILAVDDDVGVDRRLLDVALVLGPGRNAVVVGSVLVARVRRPGPVPGSGGKALLARRAQGFADAVLVDARGEAQVDTHARRRLDGGAAQRDRDVPLVGARRSVVGVLELDRDGVPQVVAQGVVDAFAVLVDAGPVEARLVVSLADVFVNEQRAGARLVVHARRGLDFFGPCGDVETQRQVAEGLVLVVDKVQVHEVQPGEFVLVDAHVEVVAAYRSRELQRLVLVVVAPADAVAFDAVVVCRLFFESANLNIVEVRGDARYVGVAFAGVPAHLVVGGLDGIPVHLGFVLAVRSVPHDLGRVGGEVADLHVLDVGRARLASQGGERERGAGAVDEPLGRVGLAAGVDGNDLEVVGRAVLEPGHVDVVRDAGDGVLDGGAEGAGLVGAVQNHCRAADVLRNLHDGGIVTDVADFHVDLGGGAVAVLFLDGGGGGSEEHCRTVDTGFGLIVVFPAERPVRNPFVGEAVGPDAAEDGAGGRVVLVARAGHVLAFGVGCAVVRVVVALVTHANQEGYVPRVHAEQVVELVDAQLLHLGGVPVLHAFLRQADAFQVLGHVGIGEYVKNVACLVAVVDPGGLRGHLVPQVGGSNCCGPVAPVRDCDGVGAFIRAG